MPHLTPMGRPQGSLPYYDDSAAPQGARSHSKGRGSEGRRVQTPPGRPQGSPPHVRIHPRPSMTTSRLRERLVVIEGQGWGWSSVGPVGLAGNLYVYSINK